MALPCWQIVLGGILSVPALLLQVVLLPLQALLWLPAIACLRLRTPAVINSRYRHVIITGGSSGIGLEIARHYSQQGLRVTILARNTDRLEAAKASLEQSSNVQAVSVDVTDYAALEKLAKNICRNKERLLLYCCAGAAYADYFENIPIETFSQSVKLNQLGPLYTVRAFLSYMQAGSHVVFISSACGQIGLFGYTSYAPTKFALRGLAECLSIELAPRRIVVQVAYPLDTDTPGFAHENKTKPRETQLMSDSGGLHTAVSTAAQIVSQVRPCNPPFSIACNFDGWMLSQLTIGFGPVTTILEGVVQVTMMNLFRWISLFYLQDWHSIVNKCQRERETNVDEKITVESSNETKEKKEQ